jgi:hypothetical protein
MSAAAQPMYGADEARHIGASQLIPGVGRTNREGAMTDDQGVGAQVEYRPLSRRQVAELRGYVAASTVVGRALLFVALVGTAALVLRAIVRAASSVLPVLSHAVWWIAPTCLLGWLLYRRSSRWTGGPEFRQQVRRDLARGQLAVRQVEAVDAVAFEEVEGCGPCYILLTRDGRTLLFDGQYLEAYRRRGFPWTCFEIREAPESGVFFGLRKAGERLKPSACVPSLSFAERKALGSFNKSCQTVEVDFATLKERGRPARS